MNENSGGDAAAIGEQGIGEPTPISVEGQAELEPLGELVEGQLVDGEVHKVDILEAPPGGIIITAADKIATTLREMSEPREDAGGLELSFASLALGLEGALGPELSGYQESGELDAFVLAITRFLATHRSDNRGRLVVVEIPPGSGKSPMRRLQLLDAAEAAQAAAESGGMPL